MVEIEIYLDDFKKSKQKEILKALGLKKASDGNFDTLPLCVYYQE